MAGPLFKKVLVPVDFSTCSLEAFRVGVELSDTFDAELTVMHVIDVNTVDAFNRLGLLAVLRCVSTAKAATASRSAENEAASHVTST